MFKELRPNLTQGKMGLIKTSTTTLHMYNRPLHGYELIKGHGVCVNPTNPRKH